MRRELKMLTSMLMTIFSITMDFLMYLANMILAKLDDSYRHRSKRVKRTTLEDRMKSINITSAL